MASTDIASAASIASARALLYSSCGEHPVSTLTQLIGRLPTWLRGTLVRNGPGSFEMGAGADSHRPGSALKHLFDGSALLQKFELDGTAQSITHMSKFLRSRTFVEGREAGQLTRREFGTEAAGSVLRTVATLLTAPDDAFTDNASVTLAKVAGKLLAMTETSLAYEVDPRDLATVAPFDAFATRHVGDVVRTTTGHPMRLPDNPTMTVNVATRINPLLGHSYELVFAPLHIKSSGLASADADLASARREIVAASTFKLVASASPAYMHSFAVTKHYVIIVECPCRFSLAGTARSLYSGGAMTGMFPWDSTAPTNFKIISQTSGTVVANIQGPSFFCLHYINAYQPDGRDDCVVIDACAYADMNIIDALFLDHLRKGGSTIPGGRWRRFRLDVPRHACSEDEITAAYRGQFELPRVADACCGSAYAFFYAAELAEGADFANIVKVDVRSAAQVRWSPRHTSVGEPVFIPRPGAAEEDDGVLTSLCLDHDRRLSFLAVIDARTMVELARAYLDHAQPLSFHGNFFTETELLE